MKRQLPEWLYTLRIVCIATLLVGTVLFGIAFGLQRLIVNAERTDCHKYEQASGYDTEFAYYGFWTQDCLVVMPDGRKIAKDQFYINGGHP